MKKPPFFLILVLLLLQVSCGEKKSHTSNIQTEGSDIRVMHVQDSALAAEIKKSNLVESTDLNDCRANIDKVVCVVDQLKEDMSSPEFDWDKYVERVYNRTCLPGGEKYTSIFKKHFDSSNKMIQKMYCSLTKIWVETELSSTAYAQPVYEGDKMIGGAIGMKKDFLDSSIGQDAWLSWKEETSFGGTTDMKNHAASLGLIKYKSNKDDHSIMVNYTINHEFGHLFDFANGLNNFIPCDEENEEFGCDALPGSWTAISWQKISVPLPENNFPLREKLCFYRCGDNKIDASRSKELFESLLKTPFNTVYATTNSYDDFAETFGYYINSQESDLQLKVETQGKVFDLIEHFNSEKLKEKRDFVRSFINGKYIYPGQSLELD